MLDIYICTFIGATVFFAQPDALKSSLSETLVEVKPTIFFSVPRIWEKFQENIEKHVKKQSQLKQSIFKWAINVGNLYTMSKFNGSIHKTFSFWLANLLVLHKIRKLMGFSNCKLFLSGAAPISFKTLTFFAGIGVPLCEVFGMSESTGPHILGHAECNSVGSVGFVKNKFNKTKILSPDENMIGEIAMFGRHIFMGYLNQEESTRETIDADGYLLSGDLGKIENNGFLRVTGRIKELIITAGGENISSIPIEDRIKNELSFISNCMLIGDNQKFLTVLLTLKVK